VYGVALGGVFFGESMVSIRPDGSKVAIARLVELALRHGIAVIDCQVPNEHLARLGSRQLPREEFLRLVRRHADAPPAGRLVPEPRRPTTGPPPGAARTP
jgi:leucyl/phenylalanyl-tRNA--protein transferase